MNYTWNIDNLDVVEINTQSNVVRSFDWTLTAELNGVNSSITEKMFTSQGTELEEIENFVEFGDLQPDHFISLVESSLGLELDLIKERLAREVKKKIEAQSVVVAPTPW